MNDERLVSVLTRAGFRGSALKTAFGIAKRESGGRHDAFNPNANTGDRSYGLFQINMLGDLGPARRRQFGLARDEDLFDPIRNAKAAYRMSQGGRDFGAWGIGPNAYRSGAGYETIAPYVSAFPGAGALRPSHARATIEARDEAKASGFRLPNWSVDSVLGGGPDSLDDDLELSDGPDLNDLRLSAPPVFERPQQARVREERPSKARSGVETMLLRGGIKLPTSFRSTHMTSGLGWPAIDIMGDPGTPVRTPVSGVIQYFHPEGAQGGGSLELIADNGRKYWLGHIAKGLTGRVRAGQPIAVIANQNVSAPHAHWARQ